MNKIRIQFFTICLLSFGFCMSTSANDVLDAEFSGQANLEHRQFFEKGLSGQQTAQSSIVLQPEWYWTADNENASVTFIPFYRYDSMDSQRSHADIRELQYVTAWDDLEYRFGIGKVFWGVTESAHLVDVINQTDAVESVDGEDKLGQPMLQLSMIKGWGVSEFFILPYFRERTFSGESGRFRAGVDINSDDAIYESDQEQKHLDFAVRYSKMLGDWDIGLSYFKGTDRDPYLVEQGGNYVPYYAQMENTGLDVQGFVGDWLWKLEAIYRDSKENYTAVVSGFEYTWVGAFGSVWDIGLISEFLYDTRGQMSFAVGQRDVFGGFRFGFNDEDSSELLFGLTQDLDNTDVQMYKLEASTRLTNHISLAFDVWLFNNETLTDPLYSVRQDDFVELAIEYYF